MGQCDAVLASGHKSEFVRALVSWCNPLVSRRDGIRQGLFAASLVVAMGLAKTGRADGAPSPVALTWDAPAGCPTAQEVAGDVDRTLSKSSAPRSPLAAAAQVLAGPGPTWQGRLVLNVHGTRTERRLQAESCQALASATALIIAVTVDETSDEPPPAPPALDVERAARPPSRPSSFVGANLVIDDDTMPSPPGAGLEAMVGRKWVVGPFRPSVVAGATVLRNLRPAVNSLLGPVSGDFWLFSLSGRGCMGVAVGQFEIAPCLGGELVAMHGTNEGRADVSLRTETHYWFSYLASLAAWYPATPMFDLFARADMLIPTARRTFDIDGNILPAYIVSSRAFRGALGLAFLFR